MTKPKQLPNESRGQLLIKDINHLLEIHDPRDVRKIVLEMFFTFVITQHNFLPYNMEKYADCIFELVIFLDKAEEADCDQTNN